MTDLSPSPETLAYYAAMRDDEAARQRAIVQARAYYAGDHPVYLTDRMKEFIGLNATESDHPFKMNLYKTVVKAVVERLKVTGFDSDEQEQTEMVIGADGVALTETVKPLARWAWQRWQQERMDARATKVHKGAVREGAYYVLVAPDEDERRACFYPHQSYTAPECDGDGYGIKVFYVDDDADNEIAYATKRWTEKRIEQRDGSIRTTNVPRLTEYWPSETRRYEQVKGAWMPYEADGLPAIQPWVDLAGNPLGVPVIPFCNQDDRGRGDDAIGIQDALNKALVDLVASADLSAFPLMVIFGFYPTIDGQPPAEDNSNMRYTGPGALLGTLKSPADADAKLLQGADLSNLGNHVDKLIQWMAMVTDTPMTRFLVTRQIASAETQKEGEGPLVSEAEYLQTIFGDAWEDCLEMARKIENTYFAAGLPENVQLSTQWAGAAVRDATVEMASAEAKSRLGVPQRKLWAEMGYSETEIQQMQAMKDEQDQAAMERQQAVVAAKPAPALSNGRN